MNTQRGFSLIELVMVIVILGILAAVFVDTWLDHAARVFATLGASLALFWLALVGVQVYTDEWLGYNHIIRPHATVCHSKHEWARDDDGDGIREVHINTTEGMWTTVRNFLRPFRGVHKKYLSGYIAMCEFGINLKRITPSFISALVALH